MRTFHASGGTTTVGAFLVPFALFKAACNLLVGGLADRHGRKPIALFGSVVGLVPPVMVLAASGALARHGSTADPTSRVVDRAWLRKTKGAVGAGHSKGSGGERHLQQ